MSREVYGHQTDFDENNFYLVGGCNENEVFKKAFMFLFFENKFKDIAKLPNSLMLFAMVSEKSDQNKVNQIMYTFGGMTSIKNNEGSEKILRYDKVKNKWIIMKNV